MDHCKKDFVQMAEPMLSYAKQLQDRLAEKQAQLEKMSVNFEAVLEQLNQATRGKDQN